MPPPTPKTLTRLDPGYPMLWRGADQVQFGLDAVVRVPAAEPWVERLLQAMRRGYRAASFDVVAHGAGAPRDEARRLREALRPVLREDPPAAPPVWVESLNLADSRVETYVRAALADEGVPSCAPGAAGAVAVVLVHGAASARQLNGHLRDDVAHLPVAFEPGTTVVGPLVVPGRTPCLSCRDAHERDRDAAWPLLHAQLIGATSERITVARAAEAARLITRILRPERRVGADAFPESRAVRVRPDGTPVWHGVSFHEECRCREPSFRSRPGSEKADVPRALPRATRTRPAFAQPA